MIRSTEVALRREKRHAARPLDAHRLFVSTAGLLTFLAAMVQHAIWFHNRIVGHVIESIAYAAITGTIFGALWPGA